MVLLPASECASNPKGASFELARDTFLAALLAAPLYKTAHCSKLNKREVSYKPAQTLHQATWSTDNTQLLSLN